MIESTLVRSPLSNCDGFFQKKLLLEPFRAAFDAMQPLYGRLGAISKPTNDNSCYGHMCYNRLLLWQKISETNLFSLPLFIRVQVA